MNSKLAEYMADEDDKFVRETLREIERALADDWRAVKKLIDDDADAETIVEEIGGLNVDMVKQRDK